MYIQRYTQKMYTKKFLYTYIYKYEYFKIKFLNIFLKHMISFANTPYFNDMLHVIKVSHTQSVL